MRFDEAQGLTDDQKAVGRGNIDAASVAALQAQATATDEALAGKVALNQGVEQAGKALIVGVDGNVTTGEAGVSGDIKTALLDIFDHVAYADGDGKQYIDALYNALYGIQPEPASGIMLDNGTKTFSDGTVVTISNNHVTVVLGSTPSDMDRSINLSNLSKNSDDITNTDNLNEPTGQFVTINANETLTYMAHNASADNTAWASSSIEDAYEISTNIRGTNNRSILPGMHLYPANSTPGKTKTTSATGQLTATSTTIGTNVILYITRRYPAGTKIEFDVVINKT